MTALMCPCVWSRVCVRYAQQKYKMRLEELGEAERVEGQLKLVEGGGSDEEKEALSRLI